MRRYVERRRGIVRGELVSGGGMCRRVGLGLDPCQVLRLVEEEGELKMDYASEESCRSGSVVSGYCSN